jgi:hypothetical protein
VTNSDVDPPQAPSSNPNKDDAELSHRIALWTFFHSRAGAQKDRMIATASSLFAVNAALLGFAFSEILKAAPDCPPSDELWRVAAGVGCAIAVLACVVIVNFRSPFRDNVRRADKLLDNYEQLSKRIIPPIDISKATRFFDWVLSITIILLLAHFVLLIAGGVLCTKIG